MYNLAHLPASPAPIFRPPGRSLSSRNVHSPSRGAARPSIVGGLDQREIMCESGLEANFATCALADPQVHDLREQPPAIQWRDASGTIRRHTFDFLVTLKDGRKLAVAVKPSKRADRSDFRATLALIAAQLPRDFADGVVLITERNLPRTLIHNATLLIQSKRNRNPEHDAAIKELVSKLGRSSIERLVESSGLEGQGFQAVVRLIAAGTVRLIDNQRIDYRAQIELADNVHEEVA